MTPHLPPQHDRRYRAKLQVRELSLAAYVARLRTDVRHLRLLRDLARSLGRCSGRAPALNARIKIVTTVARALDGGSNPHDMTHERNDHQQQQQFQLHRTALSRDVPTSTRSNWKDSRKIDARLRRPQTSDTLRRHVDSLIVCGAPSAPIVTLCGTIRGRLESSTVRELYQCAPGNSALMHALVGREVVFSSRRTLFFSTDGALERDESETDYSSSLVPIVGGRGYGLSEMVMLLAHADV